MANFFPSPFTRLQPRLRPARLWPEHHGDVVDVPVREGEYGDEEDKGSVGGEEDLEVGPDGGGHVAQHQDGDEGDAEEGEQEHSHLGQEQQKKYKVLLKMLVFYLGIDAGAVRPLHEPCHRRTDLVEHVERQVASHLNL